MALWSTVTQRLDPPPFALGLSPPISALQVFDPKDEVLLVVLNVLSFKDALLILFHRRKCLRSCCSTAYTTRHRKYLSNRWTQRSICSAGPLIIK